MKTKSTLKSSDGVEERPSSTRRGRINYVKRWSETRDKAYLIAYQMYRPHTVPWNKRMDQYKKIVSYVNKHDTHMPPVSVKPISQKIQTLHYKYQSEFSNYSHIPLTGAIQHDLPIEHQAYIAWSIFTSDQLAFKRRWGESVKKEDKYTPIETRASTKATEPETPPPSSVVTAPPPSSVVTAPPPLLATAVIEIGDITVNGQTYYRKKQEAVLPAKEEENSSSSSSSISSSSSSKKHKLEDDFIGDWKRSVQRCKNEHREVMGVLKESLLELKNITNILQSIDSSLKKRE